jgi:hypothetical protein
MTIKTRIKKLEAAFGVDDDVGLAELVEYSMRCERGEPPDLAFEARLARSAIGGLLAQTIEKNRETAELEAQIKAIEGRALRR